jgi:hypothetical protein
VVDQTATAPARRPVLITIICVIGFIGVPASLLLLFSDRISLLPSWYPALLAVSALIGLVCIIGLWMMRRWAVYTYTGFFVANQLLMLATGLWSPMALILPLIFVIIMFVYLSEMR